MVRVNHPPGGHSKLHSEAHREPQTVRVLKPPGGGSSISFTDDHNAHAPRQVTPLSPSAGVEEPKFNAESPVVEVSKDVSDVSPSVESQNDSKGTVPEADSSAGSNASDSVPQSPSVRESNESFTELSDKVSSSCIIEKDTVETQSQTTTSMSESETEVFVERSTTVTASTNGHQNTSSPVNDNSVHEENDNCVRPVNGNSIHDDNEKSASVNGKVDAKNANLPPLTIHDQVPLDKSPSPSLTPSSPSMKPNEDTRDRVIGQPAGNITPQPVPQRKIKDHMRSNIFMSDEDYTPTRSSRMNATVNDPAPTAPAAGQRQRIPPGGFSTKLW